MECPNAFVKKYFPKVGMLVHACKPSTQKTEAGGSQAQGQSEVCGKTI
jgi:hypothetical protein